MLDLTPPTIEHIRDAAQRLEGQAIRTPLLESLALNEQLGLRLLIKPEVLQRTGSFKFRGAYTKISRLDAAQRARGVVAYSSGNHAQGVALAAALHDVEATIIMPRDAPAIKIENTRAMGGDVVLYDRYGENREDIGEQICDEKGCVLVRPYDDGDVISGQGTVGLEIAEDMQKRGLQADLVLAPCGGGGLIAGTSLALEHTSPQTAVWAVEPEGFDDTARSLRSAERQSNDPTARTFCDALGAPTPGELTFPMNAQRLAGGLTVSESEIKAAMVEAFRTFKLVVEPGGAVALAAVLAGRIDAAGKTVVAICSGGNVDPALYSQIIAESA